MTPKEYFDLVWARADTLSVLNAYLSANVTIILEQDELLRAEWVMRVSALDLFVHEVVSQKLLEIFQGRRPECPGFGKLLISSQALAQIHAYGPGANSDRVFDFEVRERLSRSTYQQPAEIADGIRLVSPVELWNEVALFQGATLSSVNTESKKLRTTLTQIIDRRNKIVHEGDLKPGTPREAWPITRADVGHVRHIIGGIVEAIHAIV